MRKLTEEDELEVGIYWEDLEELYYAYNKTNNERPIIKEEDGCWTVTIKKLNNKQKK